MAANNRYRTIAANSTWRSIVTVICMLASFSAIACTPSVGPAPPPPTRDQLIKGALTSFGDPSVSVVRVRVLKGGKTGWFIVTRSLRGNFAALDTFKMPVATSSVCGPETVAWLATGVLIIRDEADQHFQEFVDEERIALGKELGLLPSEKSRLSMADPIMLLIAIALIATFLAFRRRQKSRFANPQ